MKRSSPEGRQPGPGSDDQVQEVPVGQDDFVSVRFVTVAFSARGGGAFYWSVVWG